MIIYFQDILNQDADVVLLESTYWFQSLINAVDILEEVEGKFHYSPPFYTSTMAYILNKENPGKT